MIAAAKGRAMRGSPEALGEARRRFYEIYALVRRALPDDASHGEVCAVLGELAESSYHEASSDQAAMDKYWLGRDPRERDKR